MSSNDNHQKSYRWLWVVIIAILLGCGGYVLMQEQSADLPEAPVDPMAQLWETIQHDLSEALKTDDLKVVSSGQVTRQLKSACAQGACSYLKACLKKDQSRLDKLISFSPEQQSSAQYAYQLNTCAIGQISAGLIELRKLAPKHAPNLEPLLSNFRSKIKPWSPCVNSGQIKALEITRDLFQGLPTYSSKLYNKGDVPSFVDHINKLKAQENIGKEANFLGQLITKRYFHTDNPLSIGVDKLFRTVKRAIKNPEKLCQ
jgi:hypothetical protein